MTVPEVRRLLEIALRLSARSVALRLAWSDWRRAPWLRLHQSHDRQRARQAAAAGIHDTS